MKQHSAAKIGKFHFLGVRLIFLSPAPTSADLHVSASCRKMREKVAADGEDQVNK